MFPEVVQHLDHPATHPHWQPAPHGGKAPTRFPIRPVHAPLDVVTVIANPRRFISRYDLYRRFRDYVEASGARLTTVELAYGERPFEITEPGNDRLVQLRTTHELWHKENLLNIGISRLPHDWKYVAWIDADITFARPDWAQETIQLLQHHAVIQMFSHAHDLGPDHVPFKSATGYMYCYKNGIPQTVAGTDYESTRNHTYWHPGFCYAARRDAIDALGGLIDTAILGAADLHMAAALIGRVEDTINAGLTPAYADKLRIWQHRADEHIRGNVGYMPGTIYHAYHGRKVDRRYHSRWKVLVDHQYNPETDIKRDWQGVWQLSGNKPGLRDDLMNYFHSRDEDRNCL